MARDDYFVIAAKILDYLYKCLKKGIAPDPELLSPEALGINESYWNFRRKQFWIWSNSLF